MPTAYGRALLKRSVGAFDELRQGIKDADPTVGEVRIGCPEAIASGLLVGVLDQFSSQYPHVTVRVSAADNMSNEFRQVRERQVDLLLGGVAKTFREEDLEAEILYEDRTFIVSGTNNRWASRRKLKLEELLEEPWLMPGRRFLPGRNLSIAGLGRSEVRGDVIFRVRAHPLAHHRSIYWNTVWLGAPFFPSQALLTQDIACRFCPACLVSRDRHVEKSEPSVQWCKHSSTASAMLRGL